jgi:hypothetical protein
MRDLQAIFQQGINGREAGFAATVGRILLVATRIEVEDERRESSSTLSTCADFD